MHNSSFYSKILFYRYFLCFYLSTTSRINIEILVLDISLLIVSLVCFFFFHFHELNLDVQLFGFSMLRNSALAQHPILHRNQTVDTF